MSGPRRDTLRRADFGSVTVPLRVTALGTTRGEQWRPRSSCPFRNANTKGPKKSSPHFKPNQTIRDIFEEIHPPWDMIAYRVECIGRMRSGSGVGGESADGEGGLLIDWASPLEDLKDLGITSLAFRCKPNKEQLSSSSKQGTS